MYNKLDNIILKNSIIKQFEKDEIIFDENDKCDSLVIIIDGKVKIASYTYQGNEIIFNVLTNNQMFGQSLLFSSSPFYKGKIFAVKKSKLAFINKNKLLSILLDNNLYEYFINIVSDEVLSSKQRIRILSFNNVSDRLLYLLHSNKIIYFNSISELAKTLCVTRENLSKTISKLITKQIIIKEGKFIKLAK